MRHTAKHCARFPPCGKATTAYDSGLLVFSVCEKWLCFVNVDVFDFCVIKCPHGMIDELQDRYEGVKPGYHMNKRYWISVYFHSDVPADEIRRLVRQAYETVASTLPKGQRERLTAM